MNMFLFGVLVGAGSFALIYLVMVVNKLHSGMLYLHQSAENTAKAMNLLLFKTNKIEKITENTMKASETFIDALRESAEQMMNNRSKQHDDSEGFDDIRKAFDEGIRQMEEDDEEEGDDDSENKWKE